MSEVRSDEHVKRCPVCRLKRDALNSLVTWRRHWERHHSEGPSLGNGQSLPDLRMWKLAGQIMRGRNIKTRLP